ncbi:MAG: penicillin-binding transpeptidase domain-containing protein [Myxococcota bacterium]
MFLLMLYSRARRNRYRRRPSRLTALGKAVVATTASAVLAIGWASQASRDPETTPSGEVSPVSAPPRWPTAPSFGAFAPSHGAASPASASAAPAARATDPDGSGPRSGDPIGQAPGSHPPALSAAVWSGLGPPPTSRDRFEALRAAASPPASAAIGSAVRRASHRATGGDASAETGRGAVRRSRLVETIDGRGLALPGSKATADPSASGDGSYRVEYSLDADLTARVFEILRRGRVERGIAIVIEPATGRLLSYVTTDPDVLPVDRPYPAASIVKIVTAAAMLERRSDPGAWDCLYEGNKYRLTERRLDPPRRGNHSTLEEAIATSNNQCFSHWAIHGLGEPRLRRMLERFGWAGTPGAGHARGQIAPVASRMDLGQLGSGLDGVRVTALHVASLATVLADGRLAAPRWIDRVVDGRGRTILAPRAESSRRVVQPATAERLRSLMVATTRRGTARRAFRSRRGLPVLGSIEVAGKTGNLNGSNPTGRYEWFFGVAPAKDPQIGVVVLQVHGHLWWARSSELAANILREVFCEGSACRPELATRFTDSPFDRSSPVLVSDLDSRVDPAARD